jgi:hypothetical protein
MVKINGKEVEWERHPNHTNNVYRHILWKNEETGASLAILRIEKGELVEQLPHSHPNANQYTIQLSGRAQRPDDTEISFSEGNYGFGYYPKNEKHAGIKVKGAKVIEERINLEFFDGPDDWEF